MSWILATIVGAAAGVLAAMGMGGGFVLLVFLSLFTELEQKVAQGVNLLFFIPIIIISVILHIKNKMIDVRTALICGGIGAVSVFAGFFLLQWMDNDWLRRAFGIFIILAGLKDLFAKRVDKEAKNA